VLILSADVPLIQTQTLQALIECNKTETQHRGLALLVARLPDPHGLGRIIRNDQGIISAIVEEKDATEQERKINEIYSGICCTKGENLAEWLPLLKNQNAQGEYYLTEIIALATQNGIPITSLTVENPMEIQGVNNRLKSRGLTIACNCNSLSESGSIDWRNNF